MPQEQKPINHGGKIETKYDGFNYETVMRLRKMKVNCDGFKDKFKDACVSIEVSVALVPEHSSTTLSTSLCKLCLRTRIGFTCTRPISETCRS